MDRHPGFRKRRGIPAVAAEALHRMAMRLEPGPTVAMLSSGLPLPARQDLLMPARRHGKDW